MRALRFRSSRPLSVEMKKPRVRLGSLRQLWLLFPGETWQGRDGKGQTERSARRFISLSFFEENEKNLFKIPSERSSNTAIDELWSDQHVRLSSEQFISNLFYAEPWSAHNVVSWHSRRTKRHLRRSSSSLFFISPGCDSAVVSLDQLPAHDNYESLAWIDRRSTQVISTKKTQYDVCTV